MRTNYNSSTLITIRYLMKHERAIITKSNERHPVHALFRVDFLTVVVLEVPDFFRRLSFFVLLVVVGPRTPLECRLGAGEEWGDAAGVRSPPNKSGRSLRLVA